jgi:hypothetical protein
MGGLHDGVILHANLILIVLSQDTVECTCIIQCLSLNTKYHVLSIMVTLHVFLLDDLTVNKVGLLIIQ